MKIVMLTVLIGFAFLSLDASAKRSDKRQARQAARIKHGKKNGQLTKRETRHLASEQKKIHRMEKRMKRDGKFTPKEKHRLEQAQNKASRHIHHAKHNDKKPPRAVSANPPPMENTEAPPPAMDTGTPPGGDADASFVPPPAGQDLEL